MFLWFESETQSHEASYSTHTDGYCSHEVSSTWLPRQFLNKDATNGHANMEGSELTGPQLRQLWATAEF